MDALGPNRDRTGSPGAILCRRPHTTPFVTPGSLIDMLTLSPVYLRSLAYSTASFLGMRQERLLRYARRRPRNAAVLLTTPLIHTPDCLPGFYNPNRVARLSFVYDTQLEIARVWVVQWGVRIAQLPLPAAQKAYAILQNGHYPEVRIKSGTAVLL